MFCENNKNLFLTQLYWHLHGMKNEQTHILVVEDEDLMRGMFLAQLKSFMNFKINHVTGNCERDDVVVHFAATKDEAEKKVKDTTFAGVILDHNLTDQTSEGILPALLSKSPNCRIYLVGHPLTQENAVRRVLKTLPTAVPNEQIILSQKSEFRTILQRDFHIEATRPGAKGPKLNPREPEV